MKNVWSGQEGTSRQHFRSYRGHPDPGHPERLHLGGSTTWAATIAVNDIVAKNRTAKSAINMSLSGSFSASLNQAVDSASGSGVLAIVAAGNSYGNATHFSPASAVTAVTFGAIDAAWVVAEYSDLGESVDILVPSSELSSSWNGSDNGANAISGTSKMTPHIVGLARYAISGDVVTNGTGNCTHESHNYWQQRQRPEGAEYTNEMT